MAVEQVWSIVELREHILDYVIYDNNCYLSAPNIASCRMVSKEWLGSTSSCIRLSKKPLIKLTFYQISGTYSLEKPNASNKTLCWNYQPNKLEVSLYRFIELGSKARLKNRAMFPPFCVTITQNFLNPANYPILSELLTNCESGLVEIKFEEYGLGKMTTAFSNMPPLKKLHKLTIKLLSDNVPDKHLFAAFTQSIFNASETLNEADLNLPGPEFNKLLLPTTLNKIDFSFKMDRNEWQVLTRKHLPELTNLTLECNYKKWKGEEVVNILKHVSATLRKFELKFRSSSGPRSHCTGTLHFPVMPKLEHLTVANSLQKWHIQPQTIFTQKTLPNLRTLQWLNAQCAYFKEWANCGTFPNVAELHLISSLSELHKMFEFEEVENVRRFFKGFPNLKKLKVEDLSDIAALRCIFEELGHLTNLEIELHMESDEKKVGPYVWDAMLIGVPEHSVAALRKNPKCWRQAILERNTLPSIRNLTKLFALSLSTWNYGRRQNPAPWISDALFHCALLEMPHLQHVNLEGGFWVSNKMVERWRKLGKELTNKREHQQIV